MSGTIALVGAGEFLPAMVELDKSLLATTGRPRPRVAIVPTAAYPDGEMIFRRWAAMGVEHFRSLGAEVEAVLVRNRAEADDPVNAQAVGEADLIYFSGGKPEHLLEAFEGSATWSATCAAHRRGAILVGCSAGAMVLASSRFVVRPRLGWPFGWRPGLGVVENAAVVPHYDTMPEPLAVLMTFGAPAGTAILGIDGGTALVGRDGSFQVHGRSRVTVWRGRRRERHQVGDIVRI